MGPGSDLLRGDQLDASRLVDAALDRRRSGTRRLPELAGGAQTSLGDGSRLKQSDSRAELALGARGAERQELAVAVAPPGPLFGEGEPPVGLDAAFRATDHDEIGASRLAAE